MMREVVKLKNEKWCHERYSVQDYSYSNVLSHSWPTRLFFYTQ